MGDIVSHLWFEWLLLAAFLVGGVWVMAATVLAERFGSKIGGLIGGLPSTVVVTFLFIGFAQGVGAVVEAITIYPIIMGFWGIFLVIYASLTTRNFYIAIGGAFIFWLVSSFIAAYIDNQSFILSMFVYAIILVVCFWILEHKLKLRSTRQVRPRHTVATMVGRAITSGFMIAFAVFMSKIAGPVWGGVFAAFPAAAASTLFITYRSSGLYVSRAMTKSLFLSGMITIVLYSIAVRFLYPTAGLWVGTVLSFAIAVVAGYYLYFYFIRTRIR